MFLVGGGTAGCVLARRLSEDPHSKVLVLEAGGEETAMWIAEMPLAAQELQRTGFDWQFITTPQHQAGKAFENNVRILFITICSPYVTNLEFD